MNLHSLCCSKKDKMQPKIKIAVSLSIFERNLLWWSSSGLQRWRNEIEDMEHRWRILVKGTFSPGLRGRLCLFKCEAKGKSTLGMEKVNLYHTVCDGYACEPGFGKGRGKPRSLCWHMLFGLAVWVTFCDLSISTSRGCIFSQGTLFLWKNLFGLLTLNVLGENLSQPSCQQSV